MNPNLTESALREWFARFNKQKDDFRSVSLGFGACFVVLGALSILVNGTLVGALIARKRRGAPVFYSLILNFAVVDCFKGLASVLFALKMLNGDMTSSGWSIHVDQYSGLLLRFCNLCTILNLALVTLHEYVYICYPLRYSSLVTRTRVKMFVAAIWVASFSITLANSVAVSRNRSILINDDCESSGTMVLSSCVQMVDRSTSADVFYHIGLLLFCFMCLSVTTGCYFRLFNVISRLVEEDALRQAADAPQLLRRRKFVVVIGSVIAVYLMFLVAYSAIQIIQVMHIKKAGGMNLLNVKYICYGFVALHSLLQPLCYLRMKEFRTLMKNCICRRKRDKLLTEQAILSHTR